MRSEFHPTVIAAALAAVALPLAACGAKNGMGPQCQIDAECGAAACVSGSCVPRATAPAGWGIELQPRTDETVAALTEAFVPDSGSLDLMAAGRVTVSATFTPAQSALAPMAGHVVMTVPPGIPGRPDLQFETDIMVSTVDTAVPYFSATVSQGLLGRSAAVAVTPMSPDDSVRAPLTFQSTVAPTIGLDVPSRVFRVTGNLYSAISQARSDFLARAFLDSTGQLLSNVASTDDGGGFNLVIPGIAEVLDPAQTITVELKAADSTASEPRILRHFSLGGDLTLGNIYEPAFANPNVFRFNLRGQSADGPPVSGAVIRARTVLASDSMGSADFQRDSLTDDQGNADLALLPGMLNASRPYTVAVIPPSGSPYGTLCLSSFPLATGGTAQAPALLQVLTLPLRPIVTGTVVAADGTPVSGVSIAATPAPPDPSSPCADAAGSPPAAAVTAADGSFQFVLDPGSYRFDYDPPRGSPVPRLTEIDVEVASDANRVVALPSGALVAGQALRPDGSPLVSAAVRLYEVRCTGPADCTGPARLDPWLRAQTRTDTNGNFKAVIPVP
jgi:hypothetical protein